MKRAALFAAAALCSAAAHAGDGGAKWIWHPGDYALWRGNDLQARRIEFGGGYPVFWASYAPHPLVDFTKEVDLAAPEEVEIAWEGVCRISGTSGMPSVVSNRFVFPAGRYRIVARVFSQGRPPAIYINGPHVKTDSSWSADWSMGALGRGGTPPAPAESRDAFDDPSRPPSSFRLKTVPRKPVEARFIRGGHVFADFGEETFGFLRLLGVRGRGRVRVVYGESEPEALEEDPRKVDQWEYVEADGSTEIALGVSRGWRYVHVIPEDGVAVGGVAMEEELCPLKRVGSFRCSDPLVDRIWDVSAHTLELTTRELYIEGAKRDRWTWGGDARQSYLMAYYLFGAHDLVKDSLFYQRGGDPVVMHVNNIMGYTFYWFMSVREYFRFTGDTTFLKQIYPRMSSMMDFVTGRLDGKGRPHDRPGDWMFIDWAPEPLHNTGGVTSFMMMHYVEALESQAEVAEALGLPEAKELRSRAAGVRSEVVPLFWNPEKGALMHLLSDDGTWDGQLTRYPNMFGLGWGYFSAEQRESVLGNVLFNDSVMKIQTPYMQFYELESLCALGMQEKVMDRMKSYWGGMLAEGATSFWELYNPDEKGLSKYAMYGRPYGKSLCHAWGAGPVYLLGRYFLGVSPTRPGFAGYSVKPVLGGLEWMRGEVPTPTGPVRVFASRDRVTVEGNGGEGMLELPDGRRVAIPPHGSVDVPLGQEAGMKGGK